MKASATLGVTSRTGGLLVVATGGDFGSEFALGFAIFLAKHDQ
jgi:hypothetical protein